MTTNIDSVKSMLRAVLMPEKGGLIMEKVPSMYRTLVMEPLPFKNLGFNTLIDFMHSMPDVVKITKSVDGSLMCHAVATAETAHISKMVASQKKGKSKHGKASKSYIRRPDQSRLHTYTPKFRKPFNSVPQNYQNSRQHPQNSSYNSGNFNHQSYAHNNNMVKSINKYPNSRYQGKNFDPNYHQKKNEERRKFETFPKPEQKSHTVPSMVNYSKNDPEKDLSTKENLIQKPKKLKFGEDSKYTKLITEYCSIRGIEPSYDYQRVGKNAKLGYACTLQLESSVFGSSGIYATKGEAECHAAKNAVKRLLEEKNEPKSPTLNVNTDTQKIKNNIIQMLSDKPNGLMASKFRSVYESRFKESLPTEFEEQYSSWTDVIRVDVIPGVKLKILYPVQQSSLKEESTIPDPPILAKGMNFMACISLWEDSGEFYLQSLTDNCIETCLSQLKAYYKDASNIEKKPELKIGKFCAARDVTYQQFNRALIMDIKTNSNNEKMYNVKYIDYGNSEFLPFSELAALPEEFCRLPCQALKSQLKEIFYIDAISAKEELTKIIQNKEILAQIVDIQDKTYLVNLTCDNINLNKHLIDKGFASPIPLVSPDPDPLVFPSEQEWSVYVSYISSTVDVVFRLVGTDYSEKYESLQSELESICPSLPSISNPKPGSVYCARVVIDGVETYQRVRVEGVVNFKAGCESVDEGGMLDIPTKDIKPIPAHLNKLPFQAISCKLTGLESFEKDDRILENLYKLALGKTLIAELQDRSTQLLVTLWNTETEEDVNINQLVVDILSVDQLIPTLPPKGGTIGGFVSHITNEGIIYFQIEGPGSHRLENLMEQATKQLSEADSDNILTHPCKDLLCLAQFDGNWFRALIKNILDNNQIELFCVDFGNTEIIPLSNLRHIPSNMEHLFNLPHQGIKCTLNDLPPPGYNWSQLALMQLNDFCSQECPNFTLEVVKEVTEVSSAVVEIYYTSAEGELISASEVLLDDYELFESSCVENALSIKTKDLPELQDNSGPSSGTPSKDLDSPLFEPNFTDVLNKIVQLKKSSEDTNLTNGLHKGIKSLNINDGPENSDYATLPIPQIVEKPKNGSTIYITYVCDPLHFRFIPFNRQTDLEILAENMQSYYNSEMANTKEQSKIPDNLIVGQIYAGCHTDGIWYRVLIKATLRTSKEVSDNKEKVSVYFVDFGDYSILSLEDLRELPLEFRNLPLLALKGQLAGIKCSESGWSQEVIERFSDLATEKLLTARLLTSQDQNETEAIVLTLFDEKTQSMLHTQMIHENLLEAA